MTIIKSIKGKVARVTRLDNCGAVAFGAKASLVTDGFVSVGVTPSYDEGETFRQKNAWGDFCNNERDNKRLIEAGLSVEFCAVHVDALEMTTGARLLGAGLGVAFGDDEITSRFALEVWSKVPGDACEAGEQTWLYWLFPHVGQASLGGFTINNAAMALTVDASTSRPPAGVWGDGADEPYPVSFLPADVLAPDQIVVAPTTVAPPEPTDGAVALPEPS